MIDFKKKQSFIFYSFVIISPWKEVILNKKFSSIKANNWTTDRK